MRFRAAVAFFTSADFIEEIAAASPTNVVHLIVSLNPPTSYFALKKVLWRPNVRIEFVSSGLHSKIYILEAEGNQTIAAIGSSNLTSGGLKSNIETNVILRGAEVERSCVESHFAYISDLAEALTPEILEDYKLEFEEFAAATPPRNRSKLLRQPKSQLNTGAAKSFLAFWNAAYCVHELVQDLCVDRFPDLPAYTALDYFWHYVVGIVGDEEVTAVIHEHGRDNAIRLLFSRYAKWENEGEQYWRVLGRKIKLIQTLLDEAAITSLTMPLARDVYSSLHSSERAIQRFGRDKDFVAENSIESIIASFSALLHGDERIEFRINSALTTHKLKHFGPSGVQELNGWFHPQKYPVRNSLAEKALSLLQVSNKQRSLQ